MDAQIDPGLRAAIQEAKAALSARFGDRLHSLILFGSRAWGDPEPDSDADICIVIDALTHREHVQVLEMVGEIAMDRLANLSPLVFSTQRLDRYLSTEHGLAVEIVSRGIRL